jgi:hypothetical protein
MGTYPTDCSVPPDSSRFPNNTCSNRHVEIRYGNSVPDLLLITISTSVDDAIGEYEREFPEFSKPLTLSMYISDSKGGYVPHRACPEIAQLRLNGDALGKKNSLGQRTSVFHELFHILQWQASADNDGGFDWFSEGTAVWASAHYTRAIRKEELTTLHNKPYRGLDPLGRREAVGYISFPYWVFLEALFWEFRAGKTFMADLINPSIMNSPDVDRSVLEALRSLVRAHFKRDLDWLFTSFGVALFTGDWHRKPDGNSLLEGLRDEETQKTIDIPKDVVIDQPYQIALEDSEEYIAPSGDRLRAGQLRFIRISRVYNREIKCLFSATGNRYVGVIERGEDGALRHQIYNAEFGFELQSSAPEVVFLFAGPHDSRKSETSYEFKVIYSWAG